MPSILLLGPQDSLDDSRRILLKRAGYKLSPVTQIDEAIKNESWIGHSLVILPKTLADEQRRTIKRELKDLGIGVLDLKTHRGLNRDGRGLGDTGPEVFLEVVGRAVMAAHGHPEIKGENVAWVDRDRRYLHVTDGFLSLIGYEREEVLGRLIDDFTYPGTANTKEVFTRFVDDGQMEGRYFLKHKSGERLSVDFRAAVLPDGCMYSIIRRTDEAVGAGSRERRAG